MKKHLLIAFLCGITTLSFAQSGNNCATAITAQIGAYRVDTMYLGASTFRNFPPFPDRAIWYKYTPGSDGLLTISTCNGGKDTRVFLYTGTCAQLVAAGASDDFCQHDTTTDELAAKLVKPVKANSTYYFEFDNAWDEPSFTFSVALSTFTATTTQTCATAANAVVGSDANRANWYKYTPSRNGRISVTTCGVDADTRLWVYRGTCAALTLIADSDDDCISALGDTLAVAISNLSVTAGTTYYFEFDDAWENTNFAFNLTFDAANRAEDIALANAIQVLPNPARDYVQLETNFDKMTAVNLRILNSLGQVVFAQKMPAVLRGVEILDVSRFQSGVYLVEISDGIGKTVKKLVVSH
jgi:hypothetical protein